MEWLLYAIGYSHASIHDLTSTFPMALGCSMRIFGQIWTTLAMSIRPLQEQYWSYGSKLDTKVHPFDVYKRMGGVDDGGGVVFSAPMSNIAFSTTKFPKILKSHSNGPPQEQYWSKRIAPHSTSIPLDVSKSNIDLWASNSIPGKMCTTFLWPFLTVLYRNGPKMARTAPLQEQYWPSNTWNGSHTSCMIPPKSIFALTGTFSMTESVEQCGCKTCFAVIAHQQCPFRPLPT